MPLEPGKTGDDRAFRSAFAQLGLVRQCDASSFSTIGLLQCALCGSAFEECAETSPSSKRCGEAVACHRELVALLLETTKPTYKHFRAQFRVLCVTFGALNDLLALFCRGSSLNPTNF